MSNYQLSTLLQSHTPTVVWSEIRLSLTMAYPDFNVERLYAAYLNTTRLYNGRYPGYRSCNTRYHDFSHAAETCLALTRLIHGAKIAGREFSQQEITTSLIAALLHDAGFIQEADDVDGTGAKYTATHVERSGIFLERHSESYGLSAEEVDNGRIMILYTSLSIPLEDVEASTENVAQLGKLLGAADLMAQMADRYYLEKLLYLYDEFKEADVGNYHGPVDMLRQTVGFFAVVDDRLASITEMINTYFTNHFRERWRININLYAQAIERQHAYLEQILATSDDDPRQHLRRKLSRNRYGKNHEHHGDE